MSSLAESFNNSHVLIAISALLSAIGGRVIFGDVVSSCECYLQSYTAKFLILFAILFVNTRDVHISIMFALVAIIGFRILKLSDKKERSEEVVESESK